MLAFINTCCFAMSFLKCCINEVPHKRLACAHSGKGVVLAVDYMEEWRVHETERETGSGGTDRVGVLKGICVNFKVGGNLVKKCVCKRKSVSLLW